MEIIKFDTAWKTVLITSEPYVIYTGSRRFEIITDAFEGNDENIQASNGKRALPISTRVSLSRELVKESQKNNGYLTGIRFQARKTSTRKSATYEINIPKSMSHSYPPKGHKVEIEKENRIRINRQWSHLSIISEPLAAYEESKGFLPVLKVKLFSTEDSDWQYLSILPKTLSDNLLRLFEQNGSQYNGIDFWTRLTNYEDQESGKQLSKYEVLTEHPNKQPKQQKEKEIGPKRTITRKQKKKTLLMWCTGCSKATTHITNIDMGKAGWVCELCNQLYDNN